MPICSYTSSTTSVLDLSNCGCADETELNCLIEGLANCGCEIIPTWDLFQETLNNDPIIVNLENDGTYVSVFDLITATEAAVDLVPGIGPASLAELATALETYNLEFKQP